MQVLPPCGSKDCYENELSQEQTLGLRLETL